MNAKLNAGDRTAGLASLVEGFIIKLQLASLQVVVGGFFMCGAFAQVALNRSAVHPHIGTVRSEWLWMLRAFYLGWFRDVVWQEHWQS